MRYDNGDIRLIVGAIEQLWVDYKASLDEIKQLKMDMANVIAELRNYTLNGSDVVDQIRGIYRDLDLATSDMIRFKREAEFNERLASIAAIRCRNEIGPCWCGCHITEMQDETYFRLEAGSDE